MVNLAVWKSLQQLAPYIQETTDDIPLELIERELKGELFGNICRAKFIPWMEKFLKMRRLVSLGKNILSEIHFNIKQGPNIYLAYSLIQYTPCDLKWARLSGVMSAVDKSLFILTAIKHNNLEAIQMLEDVNMAYENSTYYDVEYPSIEIFQHVVGRNNGDYINTKFDKHDSKGANDNHMITPAMACLERKNDDALRWLLAHPKFCPAQNTNNNQTSLLHWAVLFGDPRHVKWCLEKMDVDNINNKNATPLFIAAQLGHIKKLKLLLKAGADTSIRGMVYFNHKYQTPFVAAAGAGHLQMVKRLPKKHLHYALCEAILNNEVSMVRWLLKQGAPMLSHKENRSKDFALVMAIKSCTKMRKILWKAGAGAVISVEDMAGWDYFEPRAFEWPEKCCICMDKNTLPVRLKCGHISCGKCMHRLARHTLGAQGKFCVSCPECRQTGTLIEIMSSASVQHTLNSIPAVEAASRLFIDDIRECKKEAR